MGVSILKTFYGWKSLILFFNLPTHRQKRRWILGKPGVLPHRLCTCQCLLRRRRTEIDTMYIYGILLAFKKKLSYVRFSNENRKKKEERDQKKVHEFLNYLT